MKLTREQSQKLLAARGTWISEACDKCGRLLGSVRWTRRGEPGEWCSEECRDGVKTTPIKAQSKSCRQCGVTLRGKRSDSEFCSDVHRKRFAKVSTAQNRRFIAETPVQKQGLTKPKNASWTDGAISNTRSLETPLIAKSVSRGEHVQ